MGVYIRGMEMPKSCGDCPCGSVFFGYKCMAEQKKFEKYPLDSRQDWCPLVEIPPHGRLIDADTLTVRHGWLDNFDNTHTHIQFVYANEINYTPTIIGSEEKDD